MSSPELYFTIEVQSLSRYFVPNITSGRTLELLATDSTGALSYGIISTNYSGSGSGKCESEEKIVQQWLPAIRIVQIILCAIVIVFILLQVRGAGLGSAFGGSSAGSVFKTRRGVERLIFNLTIIFIILFGLVSILSTAFTPH